MIKNTGKILALCLSALMMTSVTLQAAAQDTASDRKRLERVEKQLRAIQRRVFGTAAQPADAPAKSPAAGGTSGGKIMADMSVKISAVERQMREITGRLETIEYQQEQLMKKFELLSKDTSIRFEEMRTSATNAPTAGVASPEVAPVAPELSLPQGSEESQYQWAFSYVAKNDLKNGLAALELFLAEHPTGQIAANAHFWIGKVNLQEGKFAQAAERFLTVFEEYPTHKKGPESLVELGNSMVKLGENDSACEAFLEFRRAFPDATDRLKRRVDADEKKANC